MPLKAAAITAMLRVRLAAAIAAMLPVMLAAASARAAPGAADATPETGLRAPVRITAGAANQFLGVPSPDGKHVYFASDERATTEIFVVDLAGGGPRLLFDREADATWPRPSPDGRRILYLSFREDASGDACVFDLESRKHTCLTGPATADVQALWFPDGSVGVVQRDTLHSDFRLVRIPGDGGAAKTLVSRSLSSPAVSPDGRILVYVPIERVLTEVGVTFAPRTGTGLVFQRLDRDEPVRAWRPDLPGAVGFPTFAADGRWLVFAQYRNDTNGDGSIDGADNGVVFRVALDPATGVPAPTAVPEQLTSAAWNCQYPTAGRAALFVTCGHEGSLDVYRLPLDGAVPPGWDLARLDAETRASRDPWERLLMMARALSMEPDAGRRQGRLRSIAFAEADAGDLSSADQHARALRHDAGAGAAAAEADALLELVDHRRDEQRFFRGSTSEERFQALARARAERMRALAGSVARPLPLAQLALSEILGSSGDEGNARTAFDSVPLSSLADADLVRLWARRGVELRRADGDRAGLLALYAALSAHPALEAPDRLAFAGRYVAELLRGRPVSRREAVLGPALAAAPPGSDLAFRLDLEVRLSPLGSGDPEAVRKAVFDLYRGTLNAPEAGSPADGDNAERRKVLALTTARRSAAVDAESVTYNFANTWASGVRRASPDRKTAEALYRAVVLDRAWGDLAAGNAADARGRFFEVTLQTGALEAHAGFVESRLAEGKDDLEATYARRFKDAADDPEPAFMRAYRIARDVPGLADPAEAGRAVERADALAAGVAEARPNTWEIHLLRGFLAHRRHLGTGDPKAAEDASAEYALALDLARDAPRARATLLLEAGLLQASIGNTAAALRYLDDRARLPFATPGAELALRLARARCLFLSDRDVEAADEADLGVALTDAHAELAAHKARALDRAALYAFAAGRPAVAAVRYARLRPLAEADAGTPTGRLNLARLDLASGAALLAAGQVPQALVALAAARQAFTSMVALPAPEPEFPGRAPGMRPFDRLDFVVMATALEARALEAAGRLDDAAARTDDVVRLRSARLAARGLDEDVLALAEAEYHQATTAWRRGDKAGFASHARDSLARAREYSERTGTPWTSAEVQALAGLAEAHLQGGLALPGGGPDVGSELQAGNAFLATHRLERRDAERFRIGLLAALWRLRTAGEPASR